MGVTYNTLILINGTVLPKVKAYSLERNKLWTDSGRAMNGNLRATFVGVFVKIDLEFAPTTPAQLALINSLLDNASFTVTYWDNKTQSQQSGTYYAGDFKQPLIRVTDGMNDAFSVDLIPFNKINY